MTLSVLLASPPVALFHGTSAAAVDSIRAEGLRAGTAWLTTNVADAETHAWQRVVRRACAGDSTRTGAIIEVELPLIDVLDGNPEIIGAAPATRCPYLPGGVPAASIVGIRLVDFSDHVEELFRLNPHLADGVAPWDREPDTHPKHESFAAKRARLRGAGRG